MTDFVSNGEYEMLKLTSDIVASFVSKNTLPASELPELIRAVHQSLLGIVSPVVAPEPELQKPAVPIKKSISDDYIICLEDGRKLKMLRRYLRNNYNMTPDEYRTKWNLPADYPMVAPNYANMRSSFAKQIGLGKGQRKKPVRAGKKQQAR